MQNSQVESRPRRKKPRARQIYQQPPLRGIDGRVCLEPDKPATGFLWFISPDGSRQVAHSIAAMKRASICPHCLIDSLTEGNAVLRISNDVYVAAPGWEGYDGLVNWLTAAAVPYGSPSQLYSEWGVA